MGNTHFCIAQSSNVYIPLSSTSYTQYKIYKDYITSYFISYSVVNSTTSLTRVTKFLSPPLSDLSHFSPHTFPGSVYFKCFLLTLLPKSESSVVLTRRRRPYSRENWKAMATVPAKSSSYDYLIKLLLIGDSGITIIHITNLTLASRKHPEWLISSIYRCRKIMSTTKILR